jgi:7-carboxy-7-deazaguanine synthase
MFGKNRIVGVDILTSEDVTIQETFDTIQGEGPHSGMPAYFIRLAHCCLKCWFCDTDFESKAKTLPAKEVAELVPAKRNLVVITGGEPLLQSGMVTLCETLLSKGHLVQIETSGADCTDQFLEFLELSQWAPDIVCSPKTGKIKEALKPHISAYKYVVQKDYVDPSDGLPTISTQSKVVRKLRIARPHSPHVPVYISPCDEYDEDTNYKNRLVAAEVVMKHGYILSLQTHKIVGLP